MFNVVLVSRWDHSGVGFQGKQAQTFILFVSTKFQPCQRSLAQENVSFNDLWWRMYFGDHSIVSVADIIQEVRDRHQALVLSSMASSQTLSYSRLLMQDGPGPSPSLPHQIKWANTHHGAGQTLRRAFHWNEPRNLPTRSSSDLWLTMSDQWDGLQE